MLINNKIKSFTIVELLVVMVLTVIVITITILVLNLIQKELLGMQLNYKKNTEIRILEQVLWNDFNKKTIFIDVKKNRLRCVTPLDTVLYEFNAKNIVRNKDTLNIEVINVNYYLDMKNPEEQVDGLNLVLARTFQNKQLFIYKIKASTYYMNK